MRKDDFNTHLSKVGVILSVNVQIKAYIVPKVVA